MANNTQHEPVFTMKEMALLLNCKVEKLYDIQYKYGLAYLQWYLPTDSRARRILEGSKAYWRWYTFQWEQIDSYFMNDVDFLNDAIAERRVHYQEFHNPREMAVELKPNAVVLEALNKKEVIC